MDVNEGTAAFLLALGDQLSFEILAGISAARGACVPGEAEHWSGAARRRAPVARWACEPEFDASLTVHGEGAARRRAPGAVRFETELEMEQLAEEPADGAASEASNSDGASPPLEMASMIRASYFTLKDSGFT